MTFDTWWNIFGCNTYPEDWKGPLQCGWDSSLLYSQAPSFTEEQVHALETAQAILRSHQNWTADVLLQLAHIAQRDRTSQAPAAAR